MNQIEMATLPLRTADLLEESTEKGWREMPAKTTIGHVHLHVKNLARAKMFYHKILGLNLTTTYPGAYFFAARRYHHHVAVNTWLGSDISPAQTQKIGLNHFAVRLSSIGEYEKILSLLSKYNMIIDEVSYISERNKSAFVQDINGIKILLYTE